MEDKTPAEGESQREDSTAALLREYLDKSTATEPAWERVLKSSITGVVLGSLLTLGANFVLEGFRARERARDAQQQRLQGTLQIVDDLAALVYEYQVQLETLGLATFLGKLAVSGSTGAFAEYEASHRKFATQAPVLLLKLRNRINPKYYKAVADYFDAGVAKNVLGSAYKLEEAAMTLQLKENSNMEFLKILADVRQKLDSSQRCSNDVIDFIYAAAAESRSLVDTDTQMKRDCSWRR